MTNIREKRWSGKRLLIGMEPCHMNPPPLVIGSRYALCDMRRMSSFLNASGVEKEKWFGMRSTVKRLKDIQRFMKQ